MYCSDIAFEGNIGFRVGAFDSVLLMVMSVLVGFSMLLRIISAFFSVSFGGGSGIGLSSIVMKWRSFVLPCLWRRWELPGNYHIFTVVMVIYHYVERIWRILLTPNLLYNIYNYE